MPAFNPDNSRPASIEAELNVEDPLPELSLYDHLGDVYVDICKAYAHKPDAELLTGTRESASLLGRAHGILTTSLAEDADSITLHKDLTRLHEQGTRLRTDALNKILKTNLIRRLIFRNNPLKPTPVIFLDNQEQSDITPEDELANSHRLAATFTGVFMHAVGSDTNDFIRRVDKAHRVERFIKHTAGAAAIVATLAVGTSFKGRKAA